MYAKIIKWICIAALLIAVAFKIEGGARVVVQLLLCGGAAFVLMQAARAHRFVWMTAFVLIAVYFNPVLPVEVSRRIELPLLFVCLSLFAGSLRYLPTLPRMSLATITDLPARGESL